MTRDTDQATQAVKAIKAGRAIVGSGGTGADGPGPGGRGPGGPGSREAGPGGTGSRGAGEDSRPLSSEPPSPHFALRFKEAVEHCRVDNWRRGFEMLTELAGEAGPKRVMPGIFYTYLGVAVARVGGQRHDGMELVRYGLKLQPKEPDNLCNMALLCLVLGRRSEAIRWAQQGLKRAPYHRRLNELRRELGIRRTPPVPWLDRTNPVNVLLGQVTWRLHRWRQQRYEEKRELMELERA